jgi:hypothetical protein
LYFCFIVLLNSYKAKKNFCLLLLSSYWHLKMISYSNVFIDKIYFLFKKYLQKASKLFEVILNSFGSIDQNIFLPVWHDKAKVNLLSKIFLIQKLFSTNPFFIQHFWQSFTFILKLCIWIILNFIKWHNLLRHNFKPSFYGVFAAENKE